MKNETVICISTRAWDSPWSESQKIMDIIRENNTVFFFNPGRSVNRSLFREIVVNFANFVRIKCEKKRSNLLVVYSPPTISFGLLQFPRCILRYWMPIAIYLNNWILATHIRRVKRKFKIDDEVLYVFSPYLHQLPQKMRAKVSCYHNYDEFSDFKGFQHISDLIWKFEKKLIESVDLVFCTSKSQTEKRVKVNPNTYYVPNGVDYNLFRQALNPNISMPEDLREIPRPIIGYTGIMGDHIDIKFLIAVAENFENSSVVLVGPDRLPRSKEYSLLKNMDNVYFLGFKPMEKLPHYIKYFDICLIPYVLEGHVLSGYPQKLHEYLSSGKSVVATAMPTLQQYKHVVSIARDDVHAVELIETLINEKTTFELVDKRVEVAKNNTWDNRVEIIYKHIQSKFGLGA